MSLVRWDWRARGEGISSKTEPGGRGGREGGLEGEEDAVEEAEVDGGARVGFGGAEAADEPVAEGGSEGGHALKEREQSFEPLLF
jgi:hypothetical protein